MAQLIEHIANNDAALKAPLCHAAIRRRAYHMTRALSHSQNANRRDSAPVQPLPNPVLSAIDARSVLTAIVPVPRRLLPLGTRQIGWALQVDETDRISVIGAQRKRAKVGKDWRAPRRKPTGAEQTAKRKARVGIAPNDSFVRNSHQFRLPKFSAPKPLPSNWLTGEDGAQYSMQWHATLKRSGALIHTVSLCRWPVDPWQIDKHCFKRISTQRVEHEKQLNHWRFAETRITTKLQMPITSLAQAAMVIGSDAPNGNHWIPSWSNARVNADPLDVCWSIQNRAGVIAQRLKSSTTPILDGKLRTGFGDLWSHYGYAPFRGQWSRYR